MLAFAVFALAARPFAVVRLNGLSLLALGTWGLTRDLATLAALSPLGYTLEGIGALYVLGGACQFALGFR